MPSKGLVRNETTYEIVIPFFIGANRAETARLLLHEADGLGLQLAAEVEQAVKDACAAAAKENEVKEAEVVHRNTGKE
jgi:hypothetical protein